MDESISHKKAYTDKHLDPDFCRWAFGSEVDDPIWESARDLMNAWNDLHGHKLMLQLDNIIEEDLVRMDKLWSTEGYPDGR